MSVGRLSFFTPTFAGPRCLPHDDRRNLGHDGAVFAGLRHPVHCQLTPIGGIHHELGTSMAISLEEQWYFCSPFLLASRLY